MATAILMPKAGISVESCVIGRWQKQPGDSISVGNVLFDYETDKATFECESIADGILLELFFQDGDEVPCLTPVCAVGERGEDVSALRPEASAGNTASAKDRGSSPHIPQAVAAEAAAPSDSATCVSPRARNLAKRLHVSADNATPTGPHGRVIARDIDTLAESLKTGTGIGGRSFDTTPTQDKGISGVSPDKCTGYADVKFTKIRRAIAAAMHRSLSESAQLTHHHSCDAAGIMNYRKECKAAPEDLGLGGISLNDMVMYAVVKTLKNHPDINANMIGEDTLRKFDGVHLGMAVDTPRGLVVPTIFDADKKSLKELSDEAKKLAAMAQSGSISPDLLQGGTFTVSNLGSLGVEMFTPIINPPQVAILGVCGITTRARDGKSGIETYPAMGLSLTYDHRAVDGAPASRFARDVAKNIEQFQLLLAL